MKKILFLIVALSATLNMSANAPAVSVGAAKPVVQAGVDTPEYWFNMLGEAILNVEKYANTLDAVDAYKTTLMEAVSTAKGARGGSFNLEATVDDYKIPHDDLVNVYQGVLGSKVREKLVLLDEEINAATTAKGLLAYKTYQDQLGEAISDATGVKQTYTGFTGTYEPSDIDAVSRATTALQEAKAKIIGDDYKDATSALSNSITNATTTRDEIAIISQVTANTLHTKIATAQGVLDRVDTESAPAAKELTGAASTLDKAKDTAVKTDLPKFETARDALNDAIKAALSALVGIDDSHEAIASVLSEAIGTAQLILGEAVNKSTTELTNAKKSIDTAKSSAENAEAVADQIDGWVHNAKEALKGLSGEDKTTVKTAIAKAEDAVRTKSAERDLDTAFTNLKNATTSFINADVTSATEELSSKMGYAQTVIDSELAYPEHKTELGDAKQAANGKIGSSTAEELRSATKVLDKAIRDIMDKDMVKAYNELVATIEEATQKLAEVNSYNTTLAGELETKILNANDLVEEGSAKDRYSMVYTELKPAITDADDALNAYIENRNTFDAKIQAAVTYSGDIKEKHIGIKNALDKAIVDANNVMTCLSTKTNAEIEEEIADLQIAIGEAKMAETYACDLDDMINDAESALKDIRDAEAYNGLEAAINDAKSLFSNENKQSSDYLLAKYTLKAAKEKFIKNDIAVAKSALNGAMVAANKAKTETVVDDTFKKQIEAAYNVAKGVYEDANATASEVLGAKVVLTDEVSAAVKGDFDTSEQSLTNAYNNANTTRDEYIDIADAIKDETLRASHKLSVITPFQDKITEAGTLLIQETRTSKLMAQMVYDLGTAERTMKTVYGNAWDNEKANFINAFLAEQGLAESIKAAGDYQNNVIVNNESTAKMQAGEELYQSIDEKNIAEIINARDDIEDEHSKLDGEYSAWKSECPRLLSLISSAQERYEAIQDEHKGTDDNPSEIELPLKLAIEEANGIYGDRANKFCIDILNAETALQDVINATDYADTHWDFTDASGFKAGTYEAEHAKYTRTSTKIAIGNYGTFCMPMDIKVDYEDENAQFSNVYVPENFATLSGTTLKLFLTEKKQGDVILAGTPFFAQLACAETLVLRNNNQLKVKNDGPYTVAASSKKISPKNTPIKVYVQANEGSSFVTYDKDISVSWSGTFSEVTELADKFAFDEEGRFGVTTSAIPAYRAFIKQNYYVPSTSTAKSIEAIEVDFGDGSETTGIRSILMGSSDGSQIFSIDGKKMGNDMNSLNKGVYIINGKKVLK